jgi:hypothetical protein
MADQGRWFKLWCDALDDHDLDSLDIADFGRWCKLGAQTKRHGTKGSLTIVPPARTLCAQFQVSHFDALIDAIKRLPNITFEEGKNDNDKFIVIIKNWSKYQKDSTRYERVKKWRSKQNDNALRGEEKRREEKRRDIPPISPKVGDSSFEEFWKIYPRKIGKKAAFKAWKKANINGQLPQVLSAVEKQKTTEQWKKENGQYIPHPATWLNQGRWEDEGTKIKTWKESFLEKGGKHAS